MRQRAATISAERLPGAGEERHLVPHVPAGADVPQVAHQVDDPVQLVRLEREDPLVVVQGEGATVFARTSGYGRAIRPCSTSSLRRSSSGSRYHSYDRTNGYTDT